MIESTLVHYIDCVDRVLRLLAAWLYRFFGRRVRRITVGPVDIELRGPTAGAYDQVLLKLGTAHEHMADAVTALDDLQVEYSAEMDKVERLRGQVAAKKEEYANALEELATTRQLLAADRTRIRAALGLNDTRSKVVGFVGGVFASLVAALIWKFVPIAWEFFISPR